MYKIFRANKITTNIKIEIKIRIIDYKLDTTETFSQNYKIDQRRAVEFLDYRCNK